MRVRLPVWVQVIVAAAFGFGGAAVMAQPDIASNAAHVARLDCKIKGNISIDSGERIYHVPGQDYYAATVISPQYGERWFCSEAEARQAGWRKARR